MGPSRIILLAAPCSPGCAEPLSVEGALVTHHLEAPGLEATLGSEGLTATYGDRDIGVRFTAWGREDALTELFPV